MSALAPVGPAQAGGEVAPDAAGRDAATAFEALILAQILKSARAAPLVDSPLTVPGPWAELIDRGHAEALAKAAPLGVARALAARGAR